MTMLFLLAALTLSVPTADKVDPRQRTYVMPKRIVAASCDCSRLLEPKFGQVSEGRFLDSGAPVLAATNDFVLVDFGCELHGGVAVGCGAATSGECDVRLVFGESVGEAMSSLGEKGAQQCHAIRDTVLRAPWCGVMEFGNTGFRFLKIEHVSGGALQLDSVRAVSLMRPMTAQGDFRCSDERLNEIWKTAVRTVRLCSQDYIWDGVKRDRLVWQGDMHPEVSALLAVFGADPVIVDSLDYMVRTTPPDKWMNGMPSYSMWWILCVRDLWFHTGDLSFARENASYFAQTVAKLAGCVGADGSWSFDDSWCKDGFLDWPTQHDQLAVKAGMCGLFVRAMRAAHELAVALGDDDTAAVCNRTVSALVKVVPEPHGAKSAAALLALSALRDPSAMFAEVLGRNGTDGMSTFYGYYMLEAMSAANETPYAIGVLRDYWGAMLDMGATSFWEDFNVAWTNGATRLDEMPVAGKKDIHGDFGDFCYVGFRHSLCHGWSSGPAAWLINRVLGIRILEPGAAKVEVKPCLGSLEWAEGALATPRGPVRVRADRTSGRLRVTVSAPEGVEVVDDVTDRIETLGSPFEAYYPDSFRGGSGAYARNVWTLRAFDGRVYIGCGNSSNGGPAMGCGPVPVVAYDPKRGEFVEEWRAPDEQIDVLHVFSDGALYIPGHDPTEDWSLGNFYRRRPGEGGAWEKVRTLPQGIHCYDMAEFDGRLFACGYGIYESADRGRTFDWKHDVRYYAFLRFPETLYAVATASEPELSAKRKVGAIHSLRWDIPGETVVSRRKVGGKFERVPKVKPVDIFPNTPETADYCLKPGRVSAFKDKLVYLGGIVHNDHQMDPVGAYVAEDGAEMFKARRISLPANAKPWCTLAEGGKVYLLYATNDGDAGMVVNHVAVSTDGESYRELFRFMAPTFARAFACLDGYFYFGLGTEVKDHGRWAGKNSLKVDYSTDELSSASGVILRYPMYCAP